MQTMPKHGISLAQYLSICHTCVPYGNS